jgi:DNA-binding response OmpR family regulator
MLKLVSQLLDFNKLEHNKLPLSVSLTDAHSSIRDIVEVFGVGVEQKEIALSLEGADEPLITWLDGDKFEKILYNLLSNAVKFTPFKGSIHVRTSICDHISELFPGEAVSEGNYLVVEVADSGIGIPQESMSVIFERFGQAFPSQKQGGTGIGLYFAKAMVELHHGFIKAANNNGAVFTFALPMVSDAYSESERKPRQEARQDLDNKNYLSEYTTQTPKARTNITVLVIDDDYEIIYFLKSLLSSEYKVITCFDAMSGYKLIESEQPDIIISDIMMYEMDGLQLCKMVKEDINICHIPFILLTAKSTVADQVEGLNAGADAYILKPFEPHYLMAMVGSLLRNRMAVRSLMENSTKMSKKLGESVSARDKKLLEKIYQLFEENLANTDVNAADFASECDISRTKFFYKVKGLTGMTPTEFFRVYRLNRSVELIKADKYKISSIAEMCGFSSPSHFAMSFKKQFGMLPSEYLNQ